MVKTMLFDLYCSVMIIYSRVRLQRSPGDSRSQFVIGIVRYKRNNVELPPLLKIVQQNFAGSNSKGRSKSVVAIGSSSHRGCVILERTKTGSDPSSFITLLQLMHSKVGLYRTKIFNPLDSSQRLWLLNTSLVSSNVPQKHFFNFVHDLFYKQEI